MRDLLLAHLSDHYLFYGELPGVRIARKHIGWYVSGLAGGQAFADRMNRIETTAEQYKAVDLWFSRQHDISTDTRSTNCDNSKLVTSGLQAD
jgi:tRNA-dihydrouridine synthase B